MTDAELQGLLTDLESDRAERKSSFAARDRICQAVCAFTNDLPGHEQPGVLFIGANDDGTCAGLSVTDELLRSLAGLQTDSEILPMPSLQVQKRVVSGCELAVVVVQPADAPPVRYRGRTWIRIGPRRGIATTDEERQLSEKRRARDLPFDLRPIPSATLDDLDLDLFRRTYLPSALAPDILEKNARTEETRLSSMRFATPPPESTPTVVGLLVTGSDPLRYIPGAYVQFLRFDGEELTDAITDRAEISGALPEMLRQLDDKLKANITMAVDLESVPEVQRPDYPMVALRQIVFNAILHRNYETTHAPVRLYWFRRRIEVHSPGGPYGQVTRANFGQPGITDYRNPHLAEAMRNLGYVQRFGVGIPTARAELEKNGNPPLEFDVQDAFVLTILRRRP